jgi:hypothetical protein
MTEGQQMLRKNLLAKIHQHPFCKTAKSLETWEGFLMEWYGVDSSAKLSIDELLNLYNVIQANALPKVGGKRMRPINNLGEDGITAKQKYRVERLWETKSREKNTTALMQFIYRITGKFFLTLDALSKKEASVLIAALGRL